MADLAGLFAEADRAASWANPLNRRERSELARMLARACAASWHARMEVRAASWARSLVECGAEMSDLHLDVTERAAAPAL